MPQTTVVDPNLVNETIKEFKRVGIFQFMNMSDVRFIRDMDAVAATVARSEDAGTSIQAHEAAAGIRGFAASAFRTLFEAVGLGRIFLSPQGRAIMLGVGGKEPINAKGIRLTGAALATALDTSDYASVEDLE